MKKSKITEKWFCPLCCAELKISETKCKNSRHYGQIFNRLTRKVEFDGRIKNGR